jgi:hypothetical protein
MGVRGSLRLGIGWMFVAACAGSAPIETNQTGAESSAAAPVPIRESYVVIETTTPLYLAPSLETRPVYFVPPDEHQRALAAIESARVKAEADRDKRRARWQKTETARHERERRRARTADARAAAAQAHRERTETFALDDRRKKMEVLQTRARMPGQRVRPDHHVVFKLVSEGPDWLEIRTVTDSDREAAHCYSGADAGLAGLELTFFVPREHVLPVTISEVRVDYSRYTHVWLQPGVVVVPGPNQGQRQVYVDGYELSMRIPGNQIGYAYEVGRHYGTPVTDTVFSEKAYLDDALAFDRHFRLPANPFFPLYVSETLTAGRTIYATTTTPCGRFTVEVDQSRLDAARPRTQEYDFGGKLNPQVRRPYARAGAPLYDEQGREVGRALRDTFVGVRIDDAQGRACFARDMQPRAEDDIDDVPFERRLILCVDAGDAELLKVDVFGAAL